ncbi:hypothetical protein [Rhodoferax sp.]|uniref:hypothetical protein n=1 Tax=Rhodoferax sp. TaxID=50421 RepID=UPI001EB895A3|nr:hypothetical protein [Rhodoferax sp.]MBT9508546.1 hypothetical protein [Rhodoferax sp.]
MTCLNLILPASGTVPAVLTLAQPLTAQTLLELEHAVTGTLAMLRRDLFGAGVETAAEYAVSRPDAGEIEYTSWMPDPGAIEVASWAAHMRASVKNAGCIAFNPAGPMVDLPTPRRESI